MKIRTNILVIVLVILVLLAAILALSLSSENEPGNVAQPETVTTVEVLNIASYVQNYSVTTPDSYYKIVMEEGYWNVENIENIKLDQAVVNTMISKVRNLCADSIVEENAANLAKYGLDNPSVVVEVNDEDNNTYNIHFGAQTSTKSGYYATLNDENDVYIVSTADYNMLCSGVNSLRNKQVVAISEDVYSVYIKNPKTSIAIQPKMTADPNSNNLSAWEMIEPYHKDVNEYIFEEKVLNSFDFTVDEFVDDNPTDYSAYGLDNPKYAIIINTTRHSYKILLGKEKDGTFIYMKTSDKPNVYAISKEKVAYRDFTPVYLLDSLVFSRNLISVESIVFNSDSLYTLKPDGTKFYLNNKKVDEDLFRETFLTLISSTIAGEADGRKVGKELCNFTFNYNTNTPSETVAFYEYGDMYAAAKVNGETEFYVKRSFVNNMINSVKRLAE